MNLLSPFRSPTLLLLAATSLCALRADVVLAWNELLLHAASNSTTHVPPQIEARVFAVMHVAMDEAVTSVGSDGRDAAAQLWAQRAAAVAAAHAVLLQLLPAGAEVFDALARRHLDAIPAGPDKARGIEAGNRAATRIIAARENDRWVDLAVFHPVASPMPESSAAAMTRLARGQEMPQSPWLQAVPFGLKSVEQFPVREVRSYNRNGTVFVDYDVTDASVFRRVDRLAAVDRAERVWFQRPLITWNRIARQLCLGRVTDVAQQARLLAVLNIAIADATIASLHWRHAVGTWRVVMAEHWQSLNGLPPRSTDVVAQVTDANSTELVRLEDQKILVPPTPHYPSPAATVAGAVQGALEGFFRSDRVAFELPDLGSRVGATRSPMHTFSSVSAAARECAFVASLNGSHSREACVAGYLLGESIGSYISKRTRTARR